MDDGPVAGARPTPDTLDGKYRLGRELGRGGVGRVHAATHVHLGTDLAVKVLHDELGEAPARFLQEARAAARLRHPNVVEVLDFGVDRGRPYLVMELLSGETLGSRLAQGGALAPEETARVVAGIASALAAAHAAGIVHRDLKPENVFLSGDGVKVLDFGLAKLLSAPPVVTSVTGAAVGTPAYMSPEQTQGEPDVDATSDLWALGVIAYECLTGQRPFGAESVGELVLQICVWALPVPSQHAAVPAGFDAWFATACARERGERFASAGDQAAALSRLCAGDPAPAARPRRPRRLLERALAVAAALAATAGAWALLSPTPSPTRVAVLPLCAEGDAELAAQADAVTAELIARLAGRRKLRVVARASVARFGCAGRPALATVAAELGADRLLVGRVDGEVARPHISLELIDPRDGTIAWTQSARRPADELESVAGLAASDLAAALGEPRRAAREARHPAAYRAYRTGRAYWARRDHASLITAIGYFEEALRIEPDYVAAWVGLVDAHLLLPWMGPTPRAQAYERARAALERAVALDPDSAEVQAARGGVFIEADWNAAEAERAYRRALELDPDHANAHQWLGEVLSYSRRFDESLAELDRARGLDPLVPAIHKVRARTLYYAGRYEEAVAASERALALDPSQPFASYGKGMALVRLGRFDEGLAAIAAEPVIAAAPPLMKVQELWVASRRGDGAAAARLYAEVGTTLDEHAPFVAAFAAAVAGDRARVLDLVERARAVHDPWTMQIALIPEFDPYRGEPRFAAVVETFAIPRM